MDIKALMQVAGKGKVVINRSANKEHDRVLILSMVASGYVCSTDEEKLYFTLNKYNKPSAGVQLNAEDN